MSLDPSLVLFVEELFASIGEIRVRRMFSGGGIYCEGVMFGLISRDIIYLKVDETSIPSFKAEGSSPFVYKSRSKEVQMPYWRLPERLLDERDEITDWAKKALSIARSNYNKRHARKSVKEG